MYYTVSAYSWKNLIAISGSSAGGFTALNCLYTSSIFSVAACKYPVSDLLDMVNNTQVKIIFSLLGGWSK